MIDLYAGDVISNAVRLLLAEPRVPNPPVRVWRDWWVIAAVVIAATLEQAFRPDMPWRPVGVGEIAVLIGCLLWRRTHPLAAMAVGFGMVIAIDVISIASDVEGPVSPNAMAFLLLLPYAVFRWGSGRDAAISIPIGLTAAVVGLVREPTSLVESIIGFALLALPAVLGASVRLWTTSREREVDQVRLREREQLARELHDTVAHHVSAMVIRAQAGRAVAATRPEAALEALAIIEAEGSKTLSEMRTIVSALRERVEVDLSPQVGIAELQALASSGAGELTVTVHVEGDVGDVSPAVAAALYRIAQESVTNARRHARMASTVVVEVNVEPSQVLVSVRDDGESADLVRTLDGYGVIGMTERATLLGGSLRAGPVAEGGWLVNAVLPQTQRPS